MLRIYFLRVSCLSLNFSRFLYLIFNKMNCRRKWMALNFWWGREIPLSAKRIFVWLDWEVQTSKAYCCHYRGPIHEMRWDENHEIVHTKGFHSIFWSRRSLNDKVAMSAHRETVCQRRANAKLNVGPSGWCYSATIGPGSPILEYKSWPLYYVLNSVKFIEGLLSFR